MTLMGFGLGAPPPLHPHHFWCPFTSAHQGIQEVMDDTLCPATTLCPSWGNHMGRAEGGLLEAQNMVFPQPWLLVRETSVPSQGFLCQWPGDSSPYFWAVRHKRQAQHHGAWHSGQVRKVVTRKDLHHCIGKGGGASGASLLQPPTPGWSHADPSPLLLFWHPPSSIQVPFYSQCPGLVPWSPSLSYTIKYTLNLLAHNGVCVTVSWLLVTAVLDMLELSPIAPTCAASWLQWTRSEYRCLCCPRY